MERKFFNWTGWDQVGTMNILFHGVVLERDIAWAKAGTKWSSAAIDFEEGTLELWADGDDEEPSITVQLELHIKSDI